MILGTPRELKDNEYRVGITPSAAHLLALDGHTVLVEAGAGAGSDIPDEEYARAGAEIVEEADELWERADLVLKVKEPVPEEYPRLREGQILFTYLHLAPVPELTDALLDSKVTAIAYETIEDRRGGLPLLKPMSEVAGRMSVQVGATFLERINGGRGMLLGGAPGVLPCTVLILGGGTVGLNACRIALGFGARVIVADINPEKLSELDNLFSDRLETLMSTPYNIAHQLERTDLVIGAVLVPGAEAPKVVTREMIGGMAEGSVVVDVAVDQGGCMETTRVTTHSNPVYEVDGVLHYAVSNMPGAVPRTSTFALTNTTAPYARLIANRGLRSALESSPGFLKGLNTCGGHITHPAVASSQEREAVDPAEVLPG